MTQPNIVVKRRSVRNILTAFQRRESEMVQYLASPLPDANGVIDTAEESDRLEREVSPVLRDAEALLNEADGPVTEADLDEIQERLEEAWEAFTEINGNSGARLDLHDVFPDMPR